MKLPCKECISRAICVTKKLVICSELFELGVEIMKNPGKESEKIGKKLKIILPNMKKLQKDKFIW